MLRRIYSRRGQEPDEARLTTLFSQLGPKLDGYERILSKSKYLAGEVSSLSVPRSLLH